MSAHVVSAALRAAGTTKEVARLANVSWRTMERWRRGEGEPGASVLMRLMAKSRTVAQAIAEATGLTDEMMDAEQDRLIEELTELRMRRRGNVGARNKKALPDLVANVAERAAVAGLKASAASRKRG